MPLERHARVKASIAALAFVALAAGCSQAPSPQATAAPAPPAVLETREGLASFYAQLLQGRKTASGILLDLERMVAAHPTYPFGTLVRVTKLDTLKSVVVEVVDRGPAKSAQAEGVVIDLSRAAARELAFMEDGRAGVRLEVLRWGAATPGD
jgi:rare lipoprotein A